MTVCVVDLLEIVDIPHNYAEKLVSVLQLVKEFSQTVTVVQSRKCVMCGGKGKSVVGIVQLAEKSMYFHDEQH